MSKKDTLRLFSLGPQQSMKLVHRPKLYVSDFDRLQNLIFFFENDVSNHSTTKYLKSLTHQKGTRQLILIEGTLDARTNQSVENGRIKL